MARQSDALVTEIESIEGSLLTIMNSKEPQRLMQLLSKHGAVTTKAFHFYEASKALPALLKDGSGSAATTDTARVKLNNFIDSIFQLVKCDGVAIFQTMKSVVVDVWSKPLPADGASILSHAALCVEMACAAEAGWLCCISCIPYNK